MVNPWRGKRKYPDNQGMRINPIFTKSLSKEKTFSTGCPKSNLNESKTIKISTIK
jgi:hypothetical protein